MPDEQPNSLAPIAATPVSTLTVVRDLGLALLELGTIAFLAHLHLLPSEALVCLLTVSFGARASGTVLHGARRGGGGGGGGSVVPGLAVGGLLGTVAQGAISASARIMSSRPARSPYRAPSPTDSPLPVPAARPPSPSHANNIALMALLTLALACSGCVNGKPAPAVAPVVAILDQVACELVQVFVPAPVNTYVGSVCSEIATDVNTAISNASKNARLAFNPKLCKLAPVTDDGVKGKGVVCDVFAPAVNGALAAKRAGAR